MCTVITYHSGNHYFGRNLDLDYSYNETVVIMPRHYNFIMRKMKAIESHYAIIGMATVVGNYPLFYDATNEEGLSMAGLNFPDYSYLNPYNESKDNVTSFEFIPYILSTCKNVKEARVYYIHYNKKRKKLNDDEQQYYSHFVFDILMLNIYKLLKIDLSLMEPSCHKDIYYENNDLY